MSPLTFEAAGEASPAELGYRLPAEWEHHESTWLAWPHRESDWPGKLAAIPWVYTEIVRRLSAGEQVSLLVSSAAAETEARHLLRDAGVGDAAVRFLCAPTDRSWLRDSAPLLLSAKGERRLAAACFAFNGWAKYDDYQQDAEVARQIATHLGARIFVPRSGARRVVLEGGAIELNGEGALVTTEECLLSQETQVRNPGWIRDDYERLFRETFGVTAIWWLGRGIAGDDTHGHIDDICRFVSPRTVVLCHEDDPADPNYAALAENCERLEGMRFADGTRPEVVPLPMPQPLFFAGERLPASYANFYIGNAAVLVPTFNDPADRRALGLLQELFGDRPVIGIHAVDLVLGLGTLHCLTQQQPAMTR